MFCNTYSFYLVCLFKKKMFGSQMMLGNMRDAKVEISRRNNSPKMSFKFEHLKVTQTP